MHGFYERNIPWKLLFKLEVEVWSPWHGSSIFAIVHFMRSETLQTASCTNSKLPTRLYISYLASTLLHVPIVPVFKLLWLRQSSAATYFWSHLWRIRAVAFMIRQISQYSWLAAFVKSNSLWGLRLQLDLFDRDTLTSIRFCTILCFSLWPLFYVSSLKLAVQ